jgi:hypothetical protein
MKKLVDLVEGLLHGELKGRDLLRRDSPPIDAGTLVFVILCEGALYGACMALYGLRWGTDYGGLHVAAVMVKVPALFLLTLVVTAPSLYVFSALSRSQLRFQQVVRLLLAATALSLAVLASFAPVVAFFTFSTKSHPFMQLLNAALFTIGGLIGMRFVWKRLGEALYEVPPSTTTAKSAPFGVPLPIASEPVRAPADARLGRVVLTWFLIYGTVAAQMAWILRPFVGTPHMPQELFRNTEKNIFYGLAQALKYLD